MKDFVRVIKDKRNEKNGLESVIIRKYLGDAIMRDEENTTFKMSTSLDGTGLMLEDKNGNIIGLDTSEFINYIGNHFQEILDENHNEEEH